MTPPVSDPVEELAGRLLNAMGVKVVKNGQIILHVDGEGLVQRVEVNYSPWRRRKV
jgi:hypothetical protein